MHLTMRKTVPRYTRDSITSYLLVANMTTGSKHLTTTLVEMETGGKLHMTVGDEERAAQEGDSVFIPSLEKHGLHNTGVQKLIYLSAGSPTRRTGGSVMAASPTV